MVAGALAMQVQAKERRGFGLDASGSIVPLNQEAQHLFDLGLNNDLKFRKNQRTDPDLLAEALGFVHLRDGYHLPLTAPTSGPARRVGFNTGCGPTWPYKKLGLGVTVEAIRLIVDQTNEPVLLLGGPEDDEDHVQLKSMLGDRVERSSLAQGLKHGASEINRCDVVVSGDSLGMHMAIALEKHVVAWFGVTCPQEIDLYDRGLKVLADVGCAPCWKPECTQAEPCRDKVDPVWISDAVSECLAARASNLPITGVRGADWWTPV
ncbi:MAG: glycosyltransferase family 9 protein, partial [Myxococcota bacterium]